MPSASVTASFTRSVKSLSQRSNLVMPTPITHTLRLAMAEEPTGGARRRQGLGAGTTCATWGGSPLLGCGLRDRRRAEEGLAMRNVIRGLVVASLLLGSSASVLARCGDRPGDMPAVHRVSASVAAQCGCCGRPLGPQRTTCIVPTVRAAARAGHLPRRCLGRAVRSAKRSCPLECPPPLRAGKCFDTIDLSCTDVACSPDQPCPLPNAFCNPRCLDASTCTSDADCDDGNPCSRDTCTDGTCAHECLCVGPVGRAFTGC